MKLSLLHSVLSEIYCVQLIYAGMQSLVMVTQKGQLNDQKESAGTGYAGLFQQANIACIWNGILCAQMFSDQKGDNRPRFLPRTSTAWCGMCWFCCPKMWKFLKTDDLMPNANIFTFTKCEYIPGQLLGLLILGHLETCQSVIIEVKIARNQWNQCFQNFQNNPEYLLLVDLLLVEHLSFVNRNLTLQRFFTHHTGPHSTPFFAAFCSPAGHFEQGLRPVANHR